MASGGESCPAQLYGHKPCNACEKGMRAHPDKVNLLVDGYWALMEARDAVREMTYPDSGERYPPTGKIDTRHLVAYDELDRYLARHG